jgi:hypothetical protein
MYSYMPRRSRPMLPARPSSCLDRLEGLSFIEGMSLVGEAWDHAKKGYIRGVYSERRLHSIG